MNRRTLLLIVIATASSFGGCSTRYAKSRGLDFMDAFPASAGVGLGISAQFRATPYAGFGVGYANSWRVGTDEQRLGPIWWEKERGIPVWRYYRHQNYLEETSRWSGGHKRFMVEHRNRASSLLVAPGMIREGLLWFPIYPPYMLTEHWEWPNWSPWDLLNLEVGVFAGVAGVRIGISPLQLLDFLAGIANVDLANDDLRVTPIQWPDTGATPDSFESESAETAPLKPELVDPRPLEGPIS